ncbi:type I secretion system permease/ATPase [Kiloniella laminariae]|uniref:Type I secretion system permease/ATPase n=1 Tax=Kiloniella laminariae TaxID=454162 RepID=A0ABT4LL16_9PROT|nr:type I secretion system permease/ATPase [Kiloniella laminariae]MCZ4280662.1 type I secretion system permease/ATPase [Kiloniella laminariae]
MSSKKTATQPMDGDKVSSDEQKAAVLKPADVIEGGLPPKAEWQLDPGSVNFEDPLLECVFMLASMMQRPISVEALKAGLPHSGAQFSPDLAVRAAERAGLTARTVRRATIKDIQPMTLPCILLLKKGGACILLSYDASGTASIAVPEGRGEKTVPLAELQEQYLGFAIFARAEYKFDSRASDIQLKKPKAWFWGTLLKFWPIYSHVMMASVLINMFAIASPLFIMNVYDRVVPNGASETLAVLAIGVATVFTFEFVMKNLRTYLVDVAGKNADVIIASRLLEQLMAMKLSNKPPSTGAMANNLREFESLRDFFTSGTLVALIDLPFIFLFIWIISLVAAPQIAIVPLLVVPLVIGVGFILQIPLRKVIERTHKESSQKHALLVETIDGLETIKTCAAEGRIQRSWERFVGLTADSAGKAKLLSGISTTFAQLAIQMTTVVVVIVGVFLIIEKEMTMGALVAATMLSGRALAPLGTIAGMLTRLQQSRVALKSLDNIMNAEVERSIDKTYLHRPRLSGEIELKKVTFNYPGQEVKALDNISLKIRPGERVGVLGRIGSGKSTIARLILGLYDPTEGSILADGTDIRQIDPADLRRNIGYVSQDNYLFFGSVKENISFGSPHVDDQTILRAATLAGVTDFLKTHPHGFDLQVGERGMSLSGGQRQAVVIARSLLLDPPILLMDEPTSGMDNSSEAGFKTRLTKVVAGKTLVLVTHRSSLLTLVDRLIIVDSGRIVADGPKAEVLEALKQGQIRANAS